MGRIIRDVAIAPDYNKQPLPLIGVWGNYANSVYGLNIYDSDGQNVGSANSSNYAPLTQSEFSSNSPQAHTSNANYTQITSAVPTSYNFGVKGTASAGVDGNGYLWAGPDTSFGGRHGSAPMSMHAYFGVVVGPEGYRQNFSLFHSGMTLRQVMRGGVLALDAYTLTAADGTFFGFTTSVLGVSNTQLSAANAGAGQIAYNRNLGKLCVLELKNDGANYRMHVWRHPARKLTGRVGELARFVQEAKAGVDGATYSYYDYTVPNVTTQPEAKVRCRLIPSNDDTRYTIVRMWPNSLIETLLLTQTDPNNLTASSRQTVGITTTYGCESGPNYGMRHHISWDNAWIVAYAPYYYYGVGMVAFFINLDDPALTYSYQNTETADGNQVLPFGRSGFIFSRSGLNADGGAGLYTCAFDPSSGMQPANSGAGTLANRGAVTMTFAANQFDTFYTSTNYPCLVPIERWSLPAGVNVNG